jgi:hypothetical protein
MWYLVIKRKEYCGDNLDIFLGVYKNKPDLSVYDVSDNETIFTESVDLQLSDGDYL